MRKKILLLTGILIAAFSVIGTIFFSFRIIGSVKGPEMQWVVIGGTAYEAAHDTGFSYGDRGRFMGWVTNEKQRCRVYSVKGDIQGQYLYVFWEWEGQIYERVPNGHE